VYKNQNKLIFAKDSKKLQQFSSSLYEEIKYVCVGRVNIFTKYRACVTLTSEWEHKDS